VGEGGFGEPGPRRFSKKEEKVFGSNSGLQGDEYKEGGALVNRDYVPMGQRYRNLFSFWLEKAGRSSSDEICGVCPDKRNPVRRDSESVVKLIQFGDSKGTGMFCGGNSNSGSKKRCWGWPASLGGGSVSEILAGDGGSGVLSCLRPTFLEGLS